MEFTKYLSNELINQVYKMELFFIISIKYMIKLKKHYVQNNNLVFRSYNI